MSSQNYLKCKNCGCGLTIFVGGKKPYLHSSSSGLKCHCGCNNPVLDENWLKQAFEWHNKKQKEVK